MARRGPLLPGEGAEIRNRLIACLSVGTIIGVGLALTTPGPHGPDLLGGAMLGFFLGGVFFVIQGPRRKILESRGDGGGDCDGD